MPGTPPLANDAITLTSFAAGASTPVTATTTTDASGDYSFTVSPTADTAYAVSSDPVAQVENSTLSPVFGDLLQASSAQAQPITVGGTATLHSAKAVKGVVTLAGTLAPAVVGSGAVLKIYAAHASSAASKGLKLVATRHLAAGASTFSKKVTLTRGVKWTIDVKYVNSGVITAGTSAAKTVTVS